MGKPEEADAAAHREIMEQAALRTARSATVAAWAGALTSLCAVLISVYSAYLQRQQTRATFWPELTLSFTDEPTPRLQLLNNGVGPAILRWFEVRHAGVRMDRWGAVVQAAAATPQGASALAAAAVSPADFDYAYSSVGLTRTIKAGEVVDMLVPWPVDPKLAETDGDRTRRINLSALNLLRGNEQVQVNLCYCSIFEECWLLPDNGEPRNVAACPLAQPGDFIE